MLIFRIVHSCANFFRIVHSCAKFWAKLGSYAVLSQISILVDLRVFCANFGSEKMGLCYFLHFLNVWGAGETKRQNCRSKPCRMSWVKFQLHYTNYTGFIHGRDCAKGSNPKYKSVMLAESN